MKQTAVAVLWENSQVIYAQQELVPSEAIW